MIPYELVKKFETLFRLKYETMPDTQNHWYDYLVLHNLNKDPEQSLEDLSNWVFVRPWPDIPFLIPKEFFEKVLLLGSMP